MNDKLPRLTPFAAFGGFLCGVGAIWTLIELLRLPGLVNRLRTGSDLQWWPNFVPIYGNIYLVTMAKQLNLAAKEHGANVTLATESYLWAFLFPIVNWYSLFTTYNKVADALGR